MKGCARPKQKRRSRLYLLLVALGFAVPALAVTPVTRAKQVSVGTVTAVQIGTADQARVAITWWNTDTTNPVYCDTVSTVTSATGAPIKAGNGASIDSCALNSCGANNPVYCIATGGAVVVGYIENKGGL